MRPGQEGPGAGDCHLSGLPETGTLSSTWSGPLRYQGGSFRTLTTRPHLELKREGLPWKNKELHTPSVHRSRGYTLQVCTEMGYTLQVCTEAGDTHCKCAQQEGIHTASVHSRRVGVGHQRAFLPIYRPLAPPCRPWEHQTMLPPRRRLLSCLGRRGRWGPRGRNQPASFLVRRG